MKRLAYLLFLTFITVFRGLSQDIDCKKYIKIVPDPQGYDPIGELLNEIKIPIDDTSGITFTIWGTSSHASISIHFYGIKPEITDAITEFSLTNREEVPLYTSGGPGFAIFIFGKGMADNRFASTAKLNDILALEVINESKLRGFRLHSKSQSYGFIFPPEKQDILKNAIRCILDM